MNHFYIGCPYTFYKNFLHNKDVNYTSWENYYNKIKKALNKHINYEFMSENCHFQSIEYNSKAVVYHFQEHDLQEKNITICLEGYDGKVIYGNEETIELPLGILAIYDITNTKIDTDDINNCFCIIESENDLSSTFRNLYAYEDIDLDTLFD